MNYNPADLRPGRTDITQPQINRPAPTYTSGPKLNAIEQRWNSIRATTTMIDPAVNDFLQIDVSHLMSIAHAAYKMTTATNAEAYRQAINNLQAVLNLP